MRVLVCKSVCVRERKKWTDLKVRYRRANGKEREKEKRKKRKTDK